MPARAWHRVRQFLGALRPRVSDADRAEAYAWLDPPLRAVFETMTLREFLGPHYFKQLEKMKALDAPTSDVRLVFWFDN